MNCQSIAKQLAFECTPLRGIHGEDMFELGTPFSFDDGTAINLYVINRESFAEINDDALTVHHLSGLGLDPWNARRKTSLRERIQPFGVTLRDDGALTLLSPLDQLAWSLPRFISAELAIAQWVREQTGTPQSARDLADEAEIYLRAWHPEMTISKRPMVRGISGHEYRFDFQQGNELIDVISPHHNATGGLMRKLGDILNAPNEHTPIVRIIVDDRTDHERAHVELQIIAALATAMPFSKLIERTQSGSA